MGKTGRTLILLALAAGLGLTGCTGGGESADTVAVQSVSMLAGLGNVGVQDRFAGEVVAQATQEIEKDEERTVGELLVEAGDTVQAGDVLFTYDTDEIQLSIETAQLDLEDGVFVYEPQLRRICLLSEYFLQRRHVWRRQPLF